jgi:magnesium chelatase family protein
MDRVDIRIALGAPGRSTWSLAVGDVDSASVRERVSEARARAARRSLGLGLSPALNGAQPSSTLRGPLAPGPDAAEVLGQAITEGRLSARGADRAIRVAWSLADLAGADRPDLEHLGRALTLRGDL